MFSKVCCDIKTKEVSVEDVWAVSIDVNNWHKWFNAIDYAKLEGDFCTNNSFILKPKDANEIEVKLIYVKEYEKFVELVNFPLAKMYYTHEFIVGKGILQMKNMIEFKGALAFFWWSVVGRKLAKQDEMHNRNLIERVKYLLGK